jgi:hypothetical protein
LRTLTRIDFRNFSDKGSLKIRLERRSFSLRKSINRTVDCGASSVKE